MRRLAAAHESGRLPTVDYRERRRLLLEAVTRGRPVPRQALPPGARSRRQVLWWAAGAILASIAFGLWLLG